MPTARPMCWRAGVLYRMSADGGKLRELGGGAFLASTTELNRAWLMNHIPAEDKATVTAAIDVATRDKGVFELEHRVHKAHGALGWTLSRAVPILGQEGRIDERFGAASDVTARRGAAAARAESDVGTARARGRS